MFPTLRFLHQYARRAPEAVIASEVTYQRGDESVPATVYRPRGRNGRLPGWIVLHGLTRVGRHHAALIRFVRSVAAAGNLVLVPEIPEWVELRVAPAITVDTIRAAVRALHRQEGVDHDRTGLFGFSFGATQALVAASDAEIAGLLRAIVSWGGYCNLHRLFRFGMTGEHELDGEAYQLSPDPYGCWVMAGNYLTHMPGFEDAGAVAAVALQLAQEAGAIQIPSWDPAIDPIKVRLRATLSEEQRPLFDLLAPVTGQPRTDMDHLRELSLHLADAALRVDPMMDPGPYLPLLRVTTLFAHGRDDRLIPFTETLRLARAVPAAAVHSVTITSLFAHSGGTEASLGVWGLTREAARFAWVLHRLLRLV